MASKVFCIQEHVIPCQYLREYPRATADDQEATLSLAVKQYTPYNKPSSSIERITIVGAHGNGIPKVSPDTHHLKQGMLLY